MSDFDIDYIKYQYCKYKCNKEKNEETLIENMEGYELGFGYTSLCDICQINNFIRELREFNVLT